MESDSESRVRLPSAEEIEASTLRHQIRSKRLRRRKRVVTGIVVAVLVAGVAGFWMGLQSSRTSEEIAAEQQRGAADQGFDLSRERDIILDQLWLMEDLERVNRR